MKNLREFVTTHPYFKGMFPQYLETIMSCVSETHFVMNQFIFKQGEKAEHFYLIMNGKVALETDIPNRGSVIIDTLSDGDVLGWSWLFHPFQWHFNARALEPTNAVEFDARALRDKKSEDIYFGYTLLQRTARLLESRLEATREHLVEVLASPDYQQQV